MSTKNYCDAYNYLNNVQKDAMSDLYMKGVNYDGHVWVTYTDVEEAMAILIKEFTKKNK